MVMMKKPKILCVCTAGLNRSKYLAGYLKSKGYETRYGGAGAFRSRIKTFLKRMRYGFTDNPLRGKDIKWAEIIIVVRPKHERILRSIYNIIDKKIIILDVLDTQRMIVKKFPKFKGMDSKTFNEKWTYPQLRKAIKPFLPLK